MSMILSCQKPEASLVRWSRRSDRRDTRTLTSIGGRAHLRKAGSLSVPRTLYRREGLGPPSTHFSRPQLTPAAAWPAAPSTAGGISDALIYPASQVADGDQASTSDPKGRDFSSSHERVDRRPRQSQESCSLVRPDSDALFEASLVVRGNDRASGAWTRRRLQAPPSPLRAAGGVLAVFLAKRTSADRAASCSMWARRRCPARRSRSSAGRMPSGSARR
jgi:hypothetical protein